MRGVVGDYMVESLLMPELTSIVLDPIFFIPRHNVVASIFFSVLPLQSLLPTAHSKAGQADSWPCWQMSSATFPAWMRRHLGTMSPAADFLLGRKQLG